MLAEADRLSGGRARVIAAVKGRGDAAVRGVLSTGIVDLGENRLQEHAAREGEFPGARWHFQGRVQTNKAAALGRAFEIVHTVCRAREAVALAQGGTPEILLQVNFGDPAKGGVAPGAVPELLARVARAAPTLNISGFMTMPPLAHDPEDSRPWFRALRELAERLLPGARLSMGTSQDWRVALEEGADWIRLGRALFP